MEEGIRLYSPGGAPRIVAIGGGHGLSTMLRGLKKYSRDISAIVTTADDGGGSGRLREDLGMPPPGDIRNCMEALANTEPLMRQLMHYRFTEGSLAGQSFGNLFLAALNGISPSFDAAVERMSQVLAQYAGAAAVIRHRDDGGDVFCVLLQAAEHGGKTVPAADHRHPGAVGPGQAVGIPLFHQPPPYQVPRLMSR